MERSLDLSKDEIVYYMKKILETSYELKDIKTLLERKYCPDGREHSFEIVKGTGAESGTSIWECSNCKKQVKSN
jgi:hypothetical protein